MSPMTVPANILLEACSLLPTVQKGKSSQGMAGCLTELGKHRGAQGVRWMVVLGQSYRKEGTI